MSLESILNLLELTLVFVFLAMIPGSIAWLFIAKGQSWIEVLSFGSVMGLILMAFGGVLSSWTQVYTARFIPSILLVLLGLILRKKSWIRILKAESQSSWIIIGATLGFISILGQLMATLRSQPTSWSGWWTFYGDLPFHVALTSEVLNRSPGTFPWFPGTELNYTWMIHSALGVWGSVTKPSADFLVLQAWPILFSLLLSLCISAFACRFGKQKYVVFFASSITALFIGPVGLQGTYFEYFPTYSISPTHELSQILIITIILAVHSRRSLQEFETFFEKYASSIIVFVLFLVSTASKGVMPLFIATAIGSFWVHQYIKRKVDLDNSVLLLIAASGSVVALVALVGTGGGIDFDPLSLLSDNASVPHLRSYLSIAILLIWIFTSGFISYKYCREVSDLAVMVTATTSLSVLATFLLGHPGKSQSYFLMAIVPILVVSVLNALSHLSSSKRVLYVILSSATTYVIYRVIGVFPWTITESKFLILQFVAPIIFSFITLLLFYKPLGALFKKALIYVLLVTAVSSFFAQPLRLRADVWSSPALDGSGNNVLGSLILDMRVLKELSNPYDLVLTNRICTDKTPIIFADCAPRYWFLSGYSERQVYFETYEYIMNNSTDSAKSRVSEISDFMLTPTDNRADALWSDGVRWIFIDKTRPFTDYSSFAKLKFESNYSQIWEIYGVN